MRASRRVSVGAAAGIAGPMRTRYQQFRSLIVFVRDNLFLNLVCVQLCIAGALARGQCASPSLLRFAEGLFQERSGHARDGGGKARAPARGARLEKNQTTLSGKRELQSAHRAVIGPLGV